MNLRPQFRFHAAVLLASVWGLSEAALGMCLRQCAAVLSGSLMTGAALFFLAAGWALTRRYWTIALMVLVAALFKLFDALLLGLPIMHGAIGNPIFAFILEGAALVLFLAVLKTTLFKKMPGQAILGGLAAGLAVCLFPLVRFATGVPACVAAGTGIPLSIYYAYVAVGVSLLTVPAGFWLGHRISSFEPRWKRTRPAAAGLLSSAVLAVCLAAIYLIRTV